MTLYTWSKTAAADATADATVNWQEGQAPSSVNDSGRAMMAAIAKYRDDTAGALATGGVGTAYTLTTNQVFTSTALMNGAELTFVAQATNGASPTLNVDGLGAFPITTDGTAVPAGSIVNNSVYEVVFYSSSNQFRLKNFYVNPYNIPLGGMMDYIGSTVPNSNFVFPTGQAISRTTYATLFALTGTTYGVGDGSSTFNVPDLTGRVTAMKEASATRLTTAAGGVDGATLGAVGGGQSQTLTLSQLPTGITSANASQAISVTSTNNKVLSDASFPVSSNASGGSNIQISGASGNAGSITSTGSNSISVTSNNTSGNAHPIVQPTIIVNKILRII